jgi:hypothetical protein
VNVGTAGDLERFCKIDGWTKDTATGGKRQRHIRYEKTLGPDEQPLRTQVSHDRDKLYSPGRWKAILRDQLKITEEQFWEALDTVKPVDRTPPPPPPEPIPTANWVLEGLRRAGLSDNEIDTLSPEEAEQELHRRWAGGP